MVISKLLASNGQVWTLRALFAVVILAGLTARFTPPWSINHDVSSHAYFASMLVSGATPYVDFVDPNPPLIFYLHTIPAAICQSTGWPLQPVLDLCVLGLFGFSLALCVCALRSLIDRSHPDHLYVALAAVVFVFVLYPKIHFAQREHLAIILALPYICVSIARVESGNPSVAIRITAGLLAGIGFALKAHFLLVPLFIAITLRLLRIRRAFFSTEHLCISAALACYAIHFLFWSRPAWDGFVHTAQSALEVYHGYNLPLRDLVFNAYSIGPALVAIACIGYQLWSKKSQSLLVLGVSILGFLVAAYVQGKGWSYHYLPAVLLAPLSVLLILLQFLTNVEKVFSKPMILRWLPTITVIAITILSVRTAYRWTNSPLHGCSQELIDLVEQNAPHGSIATLSTSVKPSFPLVTYTQSTWALRFNCLWLLPGLYAGIEQDGSAIPFRPIDKVGKVEKFLLDAVAEDIEHGQPDLLIIDRKRKQALSQTFDLLAYFIRVPKFSQQFKHYKLLKRFDVEDVYIRIDDIRLTD